jgi:hypothetical protein
MSENCDHNIDPSLPCWCFSRNLETCSNFFKSVVSGATVAPLSLSPFSDWLDARRKIQSTHALRPTSRRSSDSEAGWPDELVKKNRPKCGSTDVLLKPMNRFFRGKKLGFFCNLKKSALRKNSPKRRKFAQSSHTVQKQIMFKMRYFFKPTLVIRNHFKTWGQC